MSFAYVSEPGAVVGLHSKRLSVRKEKEKLAEWEMAHLEGLCLIGRVNLTEPAMQALLREGIPVSILSRDGRYLGGLVSPAAKNVPLRFRQYECHQDQPRRLALAVSLVSAKVANAHAILVRFARNHPEVDLGTAIQSCEDTQLRLGEVDSLPSLRGVEGSAARVYFEAFAHMCRGDIVFTTRTTRPPQEPASSLLSLVYTFLSNALTSMVSAIGFDPYLGFYHDIDYGRPSLALDLLEPARPAVGDRFVLHLVNNRILQVKDFEYRDGGCYLSREGYRAFVEQWDKSLDKRRVDPESGRRETIRRHLWLQAERFAAVLTAGREPSWLRIHE